jgi:hypothetical protein
VPSLASVDEIQAPRARLHHRRAADHRRERVAVRHRLREDGEVGGHGARRLVAAGRDAEAGLHLVEDEHGAGAVAHRARRDEPLGRREALDDGLEHDAGEVVARRRRTRPRARPRRRTARR